MQAKVARMKATSVATESHARICDDRYKARLWRAVQDDAETAGWLKAMGQAFGRLKARDNWTVDGEPI
jgi:hypothetical protein